MEEVKKYYDKLTKLIEEYMVPIILVIALVLIWVLVGKNLLNNFLVVGEWETEADNKRTYIIENDNCEGEFTYDGDTESEDFDCEISQGVIFSEDFGGYITIENGFMYLSNGGYEKK